MLCAVVESFARSLGGGSRHDYGDTRVKVAAKAEHRYVAAAVGEVAACAHAFVLCHTTAGYERWCNQWLHP